MSNINGSGCSGACPMQQKVRIDVTFCVGPESAIRKCIGARNPEKI